MQQIWAQNDNTNQSFARNRKYPFVYPPVTPSLIFIVLILFQKYNVTQWKLLLCSRAANSSTKQDITYKCKAFFSVNNQLNTDETECDDLKNLSYFFRLLLASSMIHSSVQTSFFLTVQMHGYNVKATQSNTSIVFHHMLHLKAAWCWIFF